MLPEQPEVLLTKFAYFCGHEQFQPEELVRHAVLAEEAGFDMVMVSEHFHPWVDDQSASGFAYATIAAMAQATERIEFVTGVTTPLFRFHPGVVAQAAATLDRLSGGRFRLGVGTGENINEGPLGYEFPAYKERNERMTEALEIMRRLLDGEKLTYDGEYYRTDRAKLYSPPLQEHLPIYLAAGGPKSATLAGEKADGVITSVKVPEETVEKVVDPLKRAAEEAGRPTPTVIATRWSIWASTENEAWTALTSWRGLRAPGRLEAVDPQELREKADQMPREEVLGRYSLVSDPQQVVDTYRPLIDDLGADVVTFQIAALDQEQLITTLGQQVLPALRD
ncbi:MAG TPA: TIGR03557 family F420-dependent LLM class oxidoreductase [Acidimicrobiia bacterium]|nr:TIGR03557 family F420-dependent LLM class oxidoreductase [Acidimicrobiia bacterium]